MKKRTTLFLFGIVVFIFFSAQAFAYGPCEKERHKGKFQGHAREVMEALQLTDAQKDDLHALCKVSRETVSANWEKFKELQASLTESVLADSESSETGYGEIINQIAELRAQMVKNRLEHWIKFVEILDSEQKEILSGRLKELRKKRPQQRMHMKKYFPFP
ncbi:MAG: Spy/CpxP family protein refolding chaperone [Deltaproteobacteria bacterium]|nr:Spy/CpxP family protein refolding chaperone [Deltaproteobacteria bacterium]